MPEKRRAVLNTVCKVGDTVVIEGEALVMVPARGK
jgi:3-hydroxybutyryl-CoA dehydratase